MFFRTLFLPLLTMASFWNSLKIGIGPDGRQYIQGDLSDLCDHFHGGEDEAKRYHDLAYTHLKNGLELLGNPDLGDKSTEDILDDAEDVKFCVWPVMTPLGGTDSRAGAINDEGVVIYNHSALLFVPPHSLEVLLLHELLEASGVYDHNYNYTTLLSVPFLLNAYEKQFKLESLKTQIKNVLVLSVNTKNEKLAREYPLQLAGGVTGVGSGGDPYISAFKAFSFAKALSQNSSLDVLVKLQTMYVTFDEPLMTAALAANPTGISIPHPKSEWMRERLALNDWFSVNTSDHSVFLQLKSAFFVVMTMGTLFEPSYFYEKIAAPPKLIETL